MVDEIVYVTKIMKTQNNLNKMIHVPFKKVIKFDLICMGLGVIMGMGIGAFLVSEL